MKERKEARNAAELRNYYLELTFVFKIRNSDFVAPK